MKFLTFSGIALAALLGACSSEPPVGVNQLPTEKDKVSREIFGTAWIFDHQMRHSDGKCPNGGSNCGRKVVTAAITTELGNFDLAVVGGPSAIASYFTSSSGGWRVLFPDMDLSEPATYAELANGSYAIAKYNYGGYVNYYMGPKTGVVDSSSFVKAAGFDS
jgi:hypothetical protein